MRFGSVCSGIEAASVAWHPLGWRASFLSEIEAFPRAVLTHHYPEVPLHGDFTSIKDGEYEPIDLLVGGTPCQSFSVAGLRGGLADDRGNLALEYLRLADRLRPRWLVWENVPGVLSSNGGRDFGSILGGLVELGYGFAYRVLDAKHFGVPQQRRRVFVIGRLGDWRAAAAVLFERSSLSGLPASASNDHVSDADWWAGEARVLNCIDASYGRKWGSNQWYARNHVIVGRDGRPRRATVLEVERCFGFPDGYTDLTQESPFARSTGAEPSVALRHQPGGLRGDAGEAGRKVRPLRRRDGAASGGSLPPDGGGEGHPLPSLQHQAPGRGGHGLGDAGLGLPGRRRGLGTDARYKALGNSMAVPVMAWIGRRIEAVDAIAAERAAA
jgi:DNA (cytosine-5)-methyltransferase 1